jgi:hypothetical protein
MYWKLVTTCHLLGCEQNVPHPLPRLLSTKVQKWATDLAEMTMVDVTLSWEENILFFLFTESIVAWKMRWRD